MFYNISRELLRVFLKIVGKLKVVGRENVPAAGGIIVASNHISYLDPPIVGMGVNRAVHFMAKEELFHSRPLAFWMNAIGTFPVRRGAADRRAIKTALDYLAKGEVLGLFPEGTRSPDGKLQEAETGVGLFAMKSRVPVVPVAIIGANKVLPPHGGIHFNRITIVYGEPLTFPDLYDSKDSRQAFAEIGKRVMAAIAKLQEKHASDA